MFVLKSYKTYGTPPYDVLLIHGGPGAAGEMSPLANKLSKEVGIVEPFQGKKTINELLLELKMIIQELGSSSVYLVGYSWGAWLSYIYSAIYPENIKKLILIGSGPFEKSYSSEVMTKRRNRMNIVDQKNYAELMKKLSTASDKNAVMRDLGKLMSKIDSFNALPVETNLVNIDFEIYQSVWEEASELRSSGQLLEYGKKISCPVVVIHGKYDPHPYEGVTEPLSKIVKDFKYILLEECGHTPWIERNAYQNFYKLLLKELE
jgi:pimeloyl-ACP methyl ester carboxylesterase